MAKLKNAGDESIGEVRIFLIQLTSDSLLKKKVLLQKC